MNTISMYTLKQLKMHVSLYVYMSIELGRLFGNLYGGCYSLKSETKNVQGQNGHNREPKLILEIYCVKLVDLAYNNG